LEDIVTAFNPKFKVGDRVRYPGTVALGHPGVRFDIVAEAFRVYVRIPNGRGRRFTAYRLESGPALVEEQYLTLAPQPKQYTIRQDGAPLYVTGLRMEPPVVSVTEGDYRV
jgi:hypothetical protein